MHKVIRIHTISFRNAYHGLVWTLKSQPNYKIHFILSIAAVIAGFYLHISYTEWLVVMMLIAIGLVIETINTTIEVTADAIDTNWREDIRIIKDVAAASMLIFSIAATCISIIIFVPKFIHLF